MVNKKRSKICTVRTISRGMAKTLKDLKTSQIEIIIKYYLHEVCKELKDGHEVYLGEMGRFKVIIKDRIFRNIPTGEMITHKDYVELKFKAWKKVLEYLKKGEDR